MDIITKLPVSSNYDVILFAVNHKEYESIEINKWIDKKYNILICDANNVFSKKQLMQIRKNDLNFISIGRG